MSDPRVSIRGTNEGMGQTWRAIGSRTRQSWRRWGCAFRRGFLSCCGAIQGGQDRRGRVRGGFRLARGDLDLFALRTVGLRGLADRLGERVTLAPPGWAHRVAAEPGPSIVFFDEWTTASPAVQAAALRPLTHGQVGVLQLPDRVSFGAAANPADVAASGWELAAPTANRFVHLDWRMPLDVYAESLVTGDWPVLPVPVVPPDIEALVAAQRGLVAGFLRSRGGQLSSIPSDAAGRGRAFPTPHMGLRGTFAGDRQ